MKSVKQHMESMVSLITESLEDADRHRKGNFSAGGRVRKILQQVTKSCKEVRQQIQDERAAN
ncbi:MAG: hypothetical protein CL582_09665 [Alteromonadaceae bacterium]|nr:hypothetical protein [Alteromonadaceae bacterium]